MDDIAATLPHNQTLMGGLHVVFTGKSSDVMITGGLENQTEGYSALIPFVMHDAATDAPSSMTLASAGIMVGLPDPAMKFPRGTAFFPYTYLRNASSSPLKVDPALYYTLAGGGGQRVALPSLTIGAGSAVQVPVDFGSLGLGSFNGLITEVFSAVSNPGDLIVATGSTDQTANYVFEVLPQLVATTKSQQDHFWRVGGGYDTMITLWNSGTAPEDLLVTFSFARGKGQYKLPVHLAAGAANAIDMAEIISEAKPDPDGNLIPPGTSGGGMVVSGPSDFMDDINVILGGGTFSVFGATCYPECYTCGPLLDGFSVAPSAVLSAVGGTTQMTSTVTYSIGTKVSETASTKWSSQNASIASVASGGMMTAVAVGATTIDGVIEWADEATTCYPTACQTIYYTGPAPVSVQVPTSASSSLSAKTTYNGSDVIECDGNNDGPGWGYSYCVTYQLLDQNTPPNNITGGNYTAQESFSVVATNVGFTSHVQNNDLNADGVFQDFLALVGTAAPGPQSGQYIIETQSITILDNNTGKTYPVRTNCLNFQYNSLNFKDITNGGTCP